MFDFLRVQLKFAFRIQPSVFYKLQFAHLFAKLPQPGESKVTFLVFAVFPVKLPYTDLNN